MKLLNNFKVSVKINLGYLLILLLMCAIAIIALVRLNEIGNTVTDMADNLMTDRQLAQQIIAEVLTVRFSANKYILTNDGKYLEQYQAAVSKSNALIKQAETDITSPERAALLGQLKTNYVDYQTYFSETSQYIQKRLDVKNNTLDVIGAKVEQQLTQLQQKAYQSNNMALVDAAGLVHAYMANAPGYI
jgi:methyl-accepting chemotaxis protein